MCSICFRDCDEPQVELTGVATAGDCRKPTMLLGNTVTPYNVNCGFNIVINTTTTITTTIDHNTN